jgi:hypothetical protein
MFSGILGGGASEKVKGFNTEVTKKSEKRKSE